LLSGIHPYYCHAGGTACNAPNWLSDEAAEAIATLAAIHCLYEQSSLPAGRELADDVLDYAADELHRSGLLDILITRAAKVYWPRPT
jgi:hypothetical protein